MPDLLIESSLSHLEGAPAIPPVAVRTISAQPDKHSRLVFLSEPAGLAVEQYKMLRRRLTSEHPLGGLMMITSPSPSDGKTLTSINLAWCLADGGHSTCLVDLDFRNPGVGSTLGCTFEQGGLEDVLQGRRSLANSICRLADRSLRVVGIKERVSKPDLLLAAESLGPVLKQMRSMFQWVVLDLPPAIPMADVAEILPHVDGALLIVRTAKTDKSLLAAPIEILGSKLWGVVLNDSPIVGSAYYAYYGVSPR
jgi:capsular exopolysaccharide synthesis family protein